MRHDTSNGTSAPQDIRCPIGTADAATGQLEAKAGSVVRSWAPRSMAGHAAQRPKEKKESFNLSLKQVTEKRLSLSVASFENHCQAKFL